VVNFTTWPLHPQGKNPPVGLWVGSEVGVDILERKKTSCPPPGTESQTVQPIA